MRKMSAKERIYQQWKEQVARPAVIARDGNSCRCCGRPAYMNEKLDLDHILGKGSHPELKGELSNLQLLCRFPCHSNKTNGRVCKH